MADIVRHGLATPPAAARSRHAPPQPVSACHRPYGPTRRPRRRSSHVSGAYRAHEKLTCSSETHRCSTAATGTCNWQRVTAQMLLPPPISTDPVEMGSVSMLNGQLDTTASTAQLLPTGAAAGAANRHSHHGRQASRPSRCRHTVQWQHAAIHTGGRAAGSAAPSAAKHWQRRRPTLYKVGRVERGRHVGL